MNRIDLGFNILEANYNKDFYFLGKGMSSVVYHDGERVYKVFIPEKNKCLENIDLNIYLLQKKKGIINNSRFFFEIHETCEGNPNILIYRYEETSKLNYINEAELIDFLADCWSKKIIVKDIKKDNFRRTLSGQLKYIDYEIDLYNDNLFLNMAVRSFIMLKYFNQSDEFLKKLKRSSINQFHLPELKGVQDFINDIFAKVIFNEGKDIITDYNQTNKITDTYISLDFNKDINIKKLFFDYIKKGMYIKDVKVDDIILDKNNYFKPKQLLIKLDKTNILDYKVSLAIKTCVQEADTIYEQVLHIVKQLSFPDSFYEIVIIVDTKEQNFLREYNSNGKLTLLIEEIKKLKKERIIDRYILLPQDRIKEVNKRWFNLETEETHTIINAPVTSHLYGFEQLKGDYILQMDSDVMIGRYDYNHSFLTDMIKEMESKKNVISVGFNIPHQKDSAYNEYTGFFKGGYVPEVRMGLFHKKRFLDQRPLPNKLIDGKLELTWFRSLHKKQEQTNYVSLRGGDPASFYIHPQNYRKTEKDVWFTILDRVENAILPKNQMEEFDLKGSYYDWTIEKRNEKVVLIVLMKNINYGRFLRMWTSVLSQTFTDWGMIIIDDVSTNGVDYFVDYIVKNHSNKVTYIKNRFRQYSAKNTYKAIHYFIDNPQSIIITLDGDDALIGKNALQIIVDKYDYNNADVVIGKMYRTDKLQAHYKYKPYFLEPRKYGGNVWQHLRSFKKYLYDSLSTYDFKFNLGNGHREWIKNCGDYAMMVPICEMASNPVIIHQFNYYFNKTTKITKKIRKSKDDIIEKILARPRKTKSDIIMRRKKYTPNYKFIEIDITFKCNLKCFSCNRSCTQAPSDEIMQFEQIRKFVKDSIKEKYKWERISILGGEPTLHPDFIKIVHYIYNEYILKYNNDTILKIVSNGYSQYSRQELKKIGKIPNVLINKKSFKSNKEVKYFIPFNKINLKKRDDNDRDYSKACWVTSYCGIGLNKYGYYGCSVAGGIDRVIGMDKGIRQLKNIKNELNNHSSIFCKYCGSFYEYDVNKGDYIPRAELDVLNPKDSMSEIWKDFYRRYNKQRPKLTEIYKD